jgi:hypothetical protein
MGIAMKQLTSYEGQHCANCGTAMQGEFCHECGQSIHSVLKPMHGMIEETVETLLHIDGRIVHTLPPLLLKPGFLTLEYFSGRRVRYIAPFRLMFVLCVLAFFVFPPGGGQHGFAQPFQHEPQTHLKTTFKDADTRPRCAKNCVSTGQDGEDSELRGRAQVRRHGIGAQRTENASGRQSSA